MFYDNFMRLCARRGIRPSPLAEELGLTSRAISKWKKGSIPQEYTLRKISDYFGVPVDELLNGKKAAPAGDISETESLVREIDANPDLKALLSLAKTASKEDLKTAIKLLKALQEDDE